MLPQHRSSRWPPWPKGHTASMPIGPCVCLAGSERALSRLEAAKRWQRQHSVAHGSLRHAFGGGAICFGGLVHRPASALKRLRGCGQPALRTLAGPGCALARRAWRPQLAGPVDELDEGQMRRVPKALPRAHDARVSALPQSVALPQQRKELVHALVGPNDPL